MKKYEENMKKYEGITLPIYMGRGTWKNSELAPLVGEGVAKYEFRRGQAREKTMKRVKLLQRRIE